MNSTLSSVSRGGCPAPFFSAAEFPDSGGFIDGRLCHELGSLNCCLPCPIVDYVYPDSFATLTTTAANWVSVAGAISAIFLLASWACLPVDRTSRHYLSISITAAVALMNLGFILPLASRPEECYNEITPNDMASSRICAASGTFLLLGGWAGVMWTFIRALSLHLQICWQVTVGRPFMIVSHLAGWGIPVAGVLIALLHSGVSFRFGPTCHINHKNSLADFWIPLLVFSGLTLILTVATFAYCVKVYLASISDTGSPTNHSTGFPSGGGPQSQYEQSLRNMTPRQAYRRVRRVVGLQWRGVTIVAIIVANLIFFSVIFVFQDSNMQDARDNLGKVQEWVLCLVEAQGDKDACLDKASGLAVSQATVAAVLFLLALNGIWLLLLLGKKDMVSAWIDLVRGCVHKRNEFVSVDARLDSAKEPPRSYEMLSPPLPKLQNTQRMSVSPPSSPARSSRSPEFFKPVLHPLSPPPPVQTMTTTTTHFAERQPPQYSSSVRYQPHARSFSAPRPPQSRDGPEAYSVRDSVSPLVEPVSVSPPTSARSRSSRPPRVNSIPWSTLPRIGPDGYFEEGPQPFGGARI